MPDKIHKGEATDQEGILTWSGFPWFGLSWPNDLQPGQICRQCPDADSLALARLLYIKIKDIEAQLVAQHVMNIHNMKEYIQYIIRALEKDIDDSDRQIAPVRISRVQPMEAVSDLRKSSILRETSCIR